MFVCGWTIMLMPWCVLNKVCVCVCVCVCLCVCLSAPGVPPVHPAVIGYLAFAGVQTQGLFSWNSNVSTIPFWAKFIENLWWTRVGFQYSKHLSRTTNFCSSLINTCPNHSRIVLNFINFDLNIFGPLPVIGAGSAPGPGGASGAPGCLEARNFAFVCMYVCVWSVYMFVCAVCEHCLVFNVNNLSN